MRCFRQEFSVEEITSLWHGLFTLKLCLHGAILHTKGNVKKEKKKKSLSLFIDTLISASQQVISQSKTVAHQVWLYDKSNKLV